MSCKPLALSTGHKKYLMQMNRPILLQSHITEESSGMLGPHVPQKALQVGLFPGSHPAFHGLQYRWQLTQWHRNHRGRGASTHMKFLQLKISTCPHTGAHILHTAHNEQDTNFRENWKPQWEGAKAEGLIRYLASILNSSVCGICFLHLSHQR